jgi:hypothetical protein
LKKPKTPREAPEQLCRTGEGSASLIPHLHAANSPAATQQEQLSDPTGLQAGVCAPTKRSRIAPDPSEKPSR